MTYCKVGESPTVVYSFAGGKKKTYSAQKCPVVVEVAEKIKPGFIGGQCPIIYNVKYQFTHGGPGGNLGATISQGSIDVLGPVYTSGWELYFPPKDGPDRGSGNEARIFIYHSNTKSSQLGMSGGISSDKSIYTSKINSVTRLNGQTDSEEPAFKGGQCEDVLYYVNFSCQREPDGLEIHFGTGSTGSQVEWGPITSIRAAPHSGGGDTEFFVTCKGTQFTGKTALQEHRILLGNGQYKYNTFRITRIRREDGQPDTCGDPKPVGTCGNPKSYCEMLIKHNDTTIFKDQGECPCTFSVQCGDCPEGQVRCNSPGYPGYCCIPCAELAQRIDTLSRRI